MKLNVSIPEIVCQQVTRPRSADDECYVAYFCSLAKLNDDHTMTAVKKFSARKISSVKNKVKKGTIWSPEGTNLTLDTEDSDVVLLSVGLYEADDKAIYKKLQDATSLIIPDDFNYINLLTLPENLTSAGAWVSWLWKNVVSTFTYLQEDDLINTWEISIPVFEFEKAYTFDNLEFNGWGGKYLMDLTVKMDK
jgi:hypothetical protein